MQHFCHFLCNSLPTEFLGPCYIFPRIFPIALTPSKIANLLHWRLWQIICNTPIIFCCITSDDRTDDNVFKNSLLFFPKTLILDRPLVLKSILQILQKSLGTMLVSFSGVFIPGLLLQITWQIPCLTPINAINKIKWHLITLHYPSGDGLLIQY